MNARTILGALDRKLTAPVELTLYGRAAIQLGYPRPPEETLLSRDVDAVLWIGQAEELCARTNFWAAADEVNRELSSCGLYISHLFTEDQVVLRPNWRCERVRIAGPWRQLALYRLGDRDLLLSKLMRDDPQDQEDARFIVHAATLSPDDIRAAMAAARVPDIPEVREQFAAASRRLLAGLERDTR